MIMDEEVENTTIELKTTDAALVFREGETNVELALPHTGDEEMVPPHVILAVAIALRLKDDIWMHELITWFNEQADEAEVEESIVEKRTLN